MTFIDYSAQALNAIERAAEGALEEVARKIANDAKKNVSGGGDSTEQLNVRGGDLRSSIAHEVDKDGLTSVGRVGSSVVYAPIHEFGGTIRAKKDWLRFKTRDGQLVRVKQVTIPARPYLRPAVMDHLPDIQKTFARHLTQKLGR